MNSKTKKEFCELRVSRITETTFSKENDLTQSLNTFFF